MPVRFRTRFIVVPFAFIGSVSRLTFRYSKLPISLLEIGARRRERARRSVCQRARLRHLFCDLDISVVAPLYTHYLVYPVAPSPSLPPPAPPRAPPALRQPGRAVDAIRISGSPCLSTTCSAATACHPSSRPVNSYPLLTSSVTLP